MDIEDHIISPYSQSPLCSLCSSPPSNLTIANTQADWKEGSCSGCMGVWLLDHVNTGGTPLVIQCALFSHWKYNSNQKPATPSLEGLIVKALGRKKFFKVLPAIRIMVDMGTH